MIRLLLISLITLSCSILYSQETSSTSQDSVKERPKIGLTLSGGAAHGFAHIGVIRYLDEIGMPIDFITGTSMGAVVGALKAMGLDSYQMEELSGKMDWRILLSNTIPLNEVTASERKFAQKIPLSLIWKENKIQLPQGLIGGQKLDLILNRLFCPTHFIEDFDSLQIPFRCVTTDLAEGSIHVQEDGYLGKKVRASMAIPSVFPPIEIEDRLMVDGGLIRNFPVQENIAMGADIVIGVNVGKQKFKKEELSSINTILYQAGIMSNILDSERQAELVDIYVIPDVKEKGLFAFSDYAYFIEKGYNAAKAQAKEFRKLKDTLDLYPPKPEITAIKTPSDLLISEIKLSEKDEHYTQLILSKLGLEKGDVVSIYDIENGISDIYGTLNFSKVNYAFFKKDEGLGLEIITELAPPFTLGVNVNRFKYYNTSLILSGEVRNLLGKTSLLYYSARASEKAGFLVNYKKRFKVLSQLLLNVESKWENYDLPFHLNANLDRVYKTYESNLIAGFQQEIGKHSLLSYQYKFLSDYYQPEILKSDNFLSYNSIRQSVGLEFQFNTIATTMFPSKGIDFEIFGDFVFSNYINRDLDNGNNFFDLENDESYISSLANFAFYFPIANKLVSETHCSFKYTSIDVFADHMRFGGPSQGKTKHIGMVGFDDSELLIGSHVYLNQVLRKEIFPRFYFGVGASYIHGRNFLSYAYNIDENISSFSSGVFLGYSTPLGPIHLDLGWSNLYEKLELNMGFGFRHIL